MEEFFSKVVGCIIAICIIAVIIVTGLIVWKEYTGMEEMPEPEEFVSSFTTGVESTTEDVTTPPIQVVENAGVQQQKQPAVNYNQVQIDKFLYNQLEEGEKYIYKAFEENKEAMKTGVAKINLGNYYTSLLSSQGGDTTLQKYYQSAVEAYTYDNPDVFYLDPNKMYLNISTTTYSAGNEEYEVYIDAGQQGSYLIDEFKARDQVETALTQVEQVKNALLNKRTGNAYRDIKMVHDYLIDTVEYDESLSKPNIYNMYGALINKVCVCEGYARAFKYVLESMGIPCVLVVGTGTNSRGQTERHAWNYVQCEGKWYAVDVTWDDPVAYGNAVVRESDKTKYFMKGASEFNQVHIPSSQFTSGGKQFQFPNIVQ